MVMGNYEGYATKIESKMIEIRSVYRDIKGSVNPALKNAFYAKLDEVRTRIINPVYTEVPVIMDQNSRKKSEEYPDANPNANFSHYRQLDRLLKYAKQADEEIAKMRISCGNDLEARINGL